MEIFTQRPAATRVAGFHAWKGLGRRVVKGTKGIRIYAPMTGCRRSSEKLKTEEESSGKRRQGVYGFRAVYVIDEADTEGEPLPSLTAGGEGDAREPLTQLHRFLSDKGIQVGFDTTIAPALGLSYKGRIAILPGLTEAETFTTLLHETAHELLHSVAEHHTETTKTLRETEAEAVAFVVASHYGIESLDSSSDYIQLYNGDASTLKQSFIRIHTASTQIIAGMDLPTNDEKKITTPTDFALPLAA